MKSEVATIKLSKLKQIVRRLEKDFPLNEDIGFEFLMSACFPKCGKQLDELLKREHTLGFIEGVESTKI